MVRGLGPMFCGYGVGLVTR